MIGDASLDFYSNSLIFLYYITLYYFIICSEIDLIKTSYPIATWRVESSNGKSKSESPSGMSKSPKMSLESDFSLGKWMRLSQLNYNSK